MALVDKVTAALRDALRAEYIRLEIDDGVSGYVVSREFEGKSTLDRQRIIDDAIRGAADPITAEEQREILMIAGLTPNEYDSVGARIRVHNIRERDDGSLEVLLHGGYSDALYVRGALNNHKGVTTSEPAQCPGAIGVLMTFSARGTEADPLTREKAAEILRADQYIHVMERKR